MGFLRVSAVVILSILLFVSLVASNTLFILESSLQYNNVKNSLYPVVKDITETGTSSAIPSDVIQNVNVSQYVQDATDQAKTFCQSNPGYVFNYSYNGYDLSIPCSSINFSAPNPAEQVINQSFETSINDFYYQNYSCSFAQCFSTVNPPTFLISQMSQEYFMSRFYLSLAILIILLALLVLAAARKANALIIIGSLLLASAIFVSRVISTVVGMLGQYGSILGTFLSAVNTTFWFSIILGGILLIAGICLRIWHKPAVQSEKKKLKK